LDLGGDFDRRIAMISIDNAVELTINTALGLPKRARGLPGPTRKELEIAGESFPLLLNLLEKYMGSRIIGLSLDEIEWYHRLRNQLYHSGNGITVEGAKVDTYLELAIALFQSLFGVPPVLKRGEARQTKTGQFLELWTRFEIGFREKLPPKNDFAYYWKRKYLASISNEAVPLYESLSDFRNNLVHGFSTSSAAEIGSNIHALKTLMKILKIDF
jgi:hypothetical protein